MSTTSPTTPQAEATQPLPVCGRRTVLRAVGLVALGGGTTAILAACGADSSTSTPSGAPTAGTSSQPAFSPNASEGASTSESEQSSSAPEGTKVAISDVPVAGGVIIDEMYVVTQPTEGQFKVFSAICTHQQNPVGEVVDQQIICPFHQSHFSITDGSVISGPAQAALPAIAFVRSGSDIVITG